MTIVTDYSNYSIRRAAVIGAGPMGTALAATLGQRIPVVMVCRNPQRAAELFEHGATMHGPVSASAQPIVVRRTADLRSLGGVSAIFLATKTTAIASVAQDLAPIFGALGDQDGAPFIISYQNGIDPGLQLREQLGDPRVLRMAINFGAVMEDDGTVRSTLFNPPNHIGTVDEAFIPVCRAIAALLTECDFATVYEPRIEDRVWMKAILNASMSPVAALVNSSIGEVLDSPARAIVDRLLHEAVAVAHAEGRDLGPDPIRRAYEVFEAGRSHIPSMVEDIRAARESEVGQLNRQLLRHAARINLAAPTHEVIDALIETFDWKIYARA